MNRKCFLAIILLCLSVSGVLAQQATVRSMRETTDFIHQDDQRRDYNNKLCALVKIQVVDEITRVEGNVMGNIVNKNVEKWVYMSEGSYQLKIHLKNNLPVSVNTRDYQIQSLKSNRVYELVIEVSQKAQPTTGSLAVRCPTGQVDFYVDGTLKQQRWGTNTWTISLTPGSHTITVRRDGYMEQSMLVNIEAGKETPAQFEALKSVKEVEEQKKREENLKKREEQQRIEQQKREEQQLLEQKKREEKELQEQKRREDQKRKEEARARAEAEKKAESEAKARQREQERKEKAEQAKIRAAQRLEKMEQRAQMPLMFGLCAGYNMSTASFSSEKGGSTSSKSGFHLGVTMDARLSHSFYLNTGLIYSAKGYSYKGQYVEEEGSPQFLDIPILGSYRIAIGKTTQLQLNAGPYLALCVGGKVTDKLYDSYDESFSSAYTGFDYGLQVGTALTFSQRYNLGIHYQLGMGSSYQNRNLMIGLGFYF